MNRLRILIATGDGGGNIPPISALAGILVKRGHEVRVLAGPVTTGAPVPDSMVERFQVLGCEVVRPDADVWTRGVAPFPDINALRKESHVLAGLAMFAVLAAPWAVQAAEAIVQFRPEIVLADLIMPGAGAAAEAAGVPYVTLLTTIPTHRILEGVAIMGGRPGDDQVEERLFFRSAFEEHVLPRTNLGRLAVGLSADQDPWAWEDRAARELVMSSETFDTIPDPMPENMRYTGSFVPKDSGSEWEDPWSPADDRPLVLVSPTTTRLAAMALPILESTADAISRMKVRALFTVGNHIDPSMLPEAENVVYRPFVSHATVLPRVSAMVSQCGHGATMSSLRHGVPMVCAPVFGDQPDVASRVVHRGAGIQVPLTSTADEVMAAISAVLFEPRYREAAHHLSLAMARENGANVAADEVEAVPV